MLKCKSLSDSSTSESEDDGYKGQHKTTFSNFHAPSHLSNKYSSTSESEDEVGKKMQQSARPSFQTESPLKRKLDLEEDLGVSRKMGKFDVSSEFKTPSSYRGLDFSSGESERDDRSSAERSVSGESFGSRKEIESGKQSSAAAGPVFNGPSLRMMEKMGYVSGTGLGKYSQGRTEIVEASKHRGRRGLGLHIKGLEPENIEWDFEKEQESVVEGITWIPRCNQEPPLMSELCDWMKEGKVKMEIDDETEFCEPSILKNVLGFKNVFDDLAPEEMRRARTRSNPFETIRGGMFLNRAAMKMANMDAAFQFMFTDPKDEAGNSIVSPGELLYFADICAGPGGFSEYILWRKKWKCKGFGFTLKGANDFKLDEFFAGPPETFEPYYGVNGIEGNGDVYFPENLEAFQNFVMTSTDKKGVHFVMADGGFSVEGQENLQEILSKRLYLCQFLCALMILRTGGHFVCKLFDLFTVFSVGLVYLMHRAFEDVSIFKPNTSRPANSERYIICRWRKESTKDICDYMFAVNQRLNEISGSDEDVCEVVPFHVIKSDEKFFDYVVDSNNGIGERQILHLAKIKAFAKNADLHEFKQSDFRSQSLEVWKVPDKARAAPSRTDPAKKFEELLKRQKYSGTTPELLNVQSLGKLKQIFEFKVVICGEARNEYVPSFFISMGRTNIYYLCPKSDKWLKVEVKLELPADTLFYGELIYELKGEGRAQKKVLALHVIDVLFLGGIDVQNFHFQERMAQARMMAKAVAKPSRPDYAPLKIKQIWALEDIKSILNRLSMKQVKGFGAYERLCYNLDDGRHFIPSGMLIFKTVAEYWVVAFSKSQQKQYYFHTKQKTSVFERMQESAANFKRCFDKRIFWSWEKRVNLLDKPSSEDEKSLVHSHTFWAFIREQFKIMTGQSPNF